MSIVIKAEKLQKNFGELEVVRGIDLDVRNGICFGILGPNGAGKTTTIKMLLGLSPLDGGSLEVLGFKIPSYSPDARKRIGVVPQVDNLDPDFTVSENLKIYGQYFDLGKEQIHKRIETLLSFVDLKHKANAKIQQLSGGMLRRLTIARALINDPDLLVLDEPTTGLDPQVRHTLWTRLFALKEQGKTLLLTTHYMEEAERLCDELVIMDKGKILDRGSPRELISRHTPGEVVEIRGMPDAGFENAIQSLEGITKVEKTVDQLICLCRDSKPLLNFLEPHQQLSILHRPSNLEDVFLALTGRELKDG